MSSPRSSRCVDRRRRRGRRSVPRPAWRRSGSGGDGRRCSAPARISSSCDCCCVQVASRGAPWNPVEHGDGAVAKKQNVKRLGGVLCDENPVAKQRGAVVELHAAGSIRLRLRRTRRAGGGGAVDWRSTRFVASSMRCETGSSPFGNFDQSAQRNAAETGHVLPDRGERRGAPQRRRRVVEADDGEVVAARAGRLGGRPRAPRGPSGRTRRRSPSAALRGRAARGPSSRPPRR